MLPKRVAVSLLVGSCLTAAVLGAYLILRRPPQTDDFGGGYVGDIKVGKAVEPVPGPGATRPVDESAGGSGGSSAPSGTRQSGARRADAGPTGGSSQTRAQDRPIILLPPRPPTTAAGATPTWGPMQPGGAPAGSSGSTAAPKAGAAGKDPAPEVEPVEVPAGTELQIVFKKPLSSEQVKVEDKVEAELTRDVRVGDRVALPAGSRVEGHVAKVEVGGKLRRRALVAVAFDSVMGVDGSRSRLQTKPVIREGDSPLKQSALKVGVGALGGAIAGILLGDSKDAVRGGSTGAAAGAASAASGQRLPAVIAAGTNFALVLDAPVTVQAEKRP